VSRPRPFVFLPADGEAITLDDLAEFLVEARANGIPGEAQVRAAGRIEVNLAHGPRVARLTVVPQEVARVQL
jgi:hypothetical protein